MSAKAFLAGFVLLVSTTVTPAASSQVDPSFDPGSGINGYVVKMCVVESGKILIAGSFTTVQGAFRGGIARLNADGTTDTTFMDGLPGANWEVKCMQVLADNRILVGGYFTTLNGTSCGHFGCLKEDGTLDASFRADFTSEDGWPLVTSVAVQGDGKIVVGGNFTKVNGLAHTNVVRLNADGSVDTGFRAYATGGHVEVRGIDEIAVLSNTDILLAGSFSVVNGVPCSSLARLNADGSLDTKFTSPMQGGDQDIDSMFVQPDGKILIGGWFTTVNGVSRTGLVRLNEDGSVDGGFRADADNGVHGITMQPDGKLIIGGYFTSVNGVPRNKLARLNADGSPDRSFESGLQGTVVSVYSVAVQPDGRVLAGGDLDMEQRDYLRRLKSDGRLDDSFGPQNGGLNFQAKALALQADGKVLVGGHFKFFDGVAQPYLVRMNENGAADSAFMEGLPGPNAPVLDILVQADGKILIRGYFLSVNGVERYNFARLNADGSVDSSFQGNIPLSSRTLNMMALQADGRIVLGGSFESVNGERRPGIARLNEDGSLDHDFAPSLGDSPWIYQVVIQRDNKILVGGYRTENGLPAPLVRLNPDGSFDPSFRYSPELYGGGPIAVQEDGRIVLALETLNSPYPMVGRLNPDGSPDHTFAPVLLNEDVFTIEISDDGTVYIGGVFSTVNGVEHWCLAALRPDGSVDPEFGAGKAIVNERVTCARLRPDGRLLICGAFTASGYAARKYVAQLMGCWAPLQILRGPATQTAETGETVAFNVVAKGYPRPWSQWIFNGNEAVGGAIESRLTLRDITALHSGEYRLVLTNATGAVTSAPAMLSVIPAVPRRTVPCIGIADGPGQDITVESADQPWGSWRPLGDVKLLNGGAMYFDAEDQTPNSRYYRTKGAGGPASELNITMVPALTLTGVVGDLIRIDTIARLGPTNAWETVETVALTSSPQLYFDLGASTFPPRLYRLTPLRQRQDHLPPPRAQERRSDF